MYKNRSLFEQILKISGQGADFYVRAQNGLRTPGLSSVFACLAAAKLELLIPLRGLRLRILGEEHDYAPELEKIPEIYQQAEVQLSPETVHFLLPRLAEIEDLMLTHASVLLQETDDPVIREHLQTYVTKAQRCHGKLQDFMSPVTLAA